MASLLKPLWPLQARVEPGLSQQIGCPIKQTFPAPQLNFVTLYAPPFPNPQSSAELQPVLILLACRWGSLAKACPLLGFLLLIFFFFLCKKHQHGARRSTHIFNWRLYFLVAALNLIFHGFHQITAMACLTWHHIQTLRDGASATQSQCGCLEVHEAPRCEHSWLAGELQRSAEAIAQPVCWR